MKKRVGKWLLSAVLSAAILMNLMVVPVQAATGERGNIQVSIPALQFSSSYAAYSSQKYAEDGAITFYLEEDEFPVEVTITGSNGATETYSFDTYGTKLLTVEDPGWGTIGTALVLFPTIVGSLAVLDNAPCSYAVINLAPPKADVPDETGMTPDSAKSTEVVDPYKTLMSEISFPFCYRDSSTYAKEIAAYYAGEWDGKRLEGDDWGSYSASRYVDSFRVYHWTACNLYTGEMYQLSSSVDYAGLLETVPGRNFTLAVSDVMGVVELWYHFDKQDSWEISTSEGKIESVYPLGSDGSDSLVLVYVIDANGEQHMYSLLSGGKVEKIA